MSNLESFATTYASMTDDDLRRIAFDVENLVPLAREALHSEFIHRNFSTREVDWEAQPSQPSSLGEEQPPDLGQGMKKSNGLFSIFFRNFLICIFCSGILCAFATAILFRTATTDWEKLGEAITKFVLYSSAFLGFTTAKLISPEKYGRIWLIGSVAPLPVILFAVAQILMHQHR